MIKKINNKQKDFYAVMGKVFGSREIQRATKDRFFDDEEKEWYIYLYREELRGVVSLKRGVIKNVYSKSYRGLVSLLNKIPGDLKGKVPRIYKKEFGDAGYKIISEKGNFVDVEKEE